MVPYPSSLGWASGTRSSLRNTGSTILGESWQTIQATKLTPKDVGGFGSMHQGGANFVLADGAVKFFSQSIDPQIYEHLGNRQDGEMVGDSFY
jgi:prepilin-type processing-associated H-X9-DG protein